VAWQNFMNFYGCNWIVIPVAGFSELAHLSDNLHCGLRKLEDVDLDNDGVYKLHFAIRHQSQEIIHRFIEAIPTEMQIKPWIPLSEEMYLKGIDFSEFWYSLEPLEQDSWLDVIIRSGYFNQRRDGN
jgi:hypothetical protein